MQTVLAKDVKFLLKDPRSTDTTLISLVYRYDNCRFVYSTGQFIEPYQWGVTNQRAYTNQKARPVRQDHETINAHLDRHRTALVRVLASIQLAGSAINNALLKQDLDKELGRVRATKSETVQAKTVETFTEYIVRFVGDAKAGRRLNAKNARFADGTLKNFMKYKSMNYRAGSLFKSKAGNSSGSVEKTEHSNEIADSHLQCIKLILNEFSRA